MADGSMAARGLLLLVAALLVCCRAVDGDEYDEPLYLTPFIIQGDLESARNLSKVELDDVLLDSYAGLITVDESVDSHMFFWFFVATNKPEKAPVMLWLQGGPGMSSMYGLFNEHGPFSLYEGRLKLRDTAWTNDYSVLYVDNPVGTGYSSTGYEQGYSKEQMSIGKNLYKMLVQFFMLFPEFRENDFYVAGESYAGKYVPAVAYTIHSNNPSAKVKINLKGLAIGNGLVDPYNQMVYGDYLYQYSLINEDQRDEFKEIESGIRNLIYYGEYSRAAELYYSMVLEGMMYPYPSMFKNMTGMHCYYNILKDCDQTQNNNWENFIQTSKMRSALHVGQQFFDNGLKVQEHLLEDKMQSVAGWLAELLESNLYNVILYSGQLDIIVPYPGTIRMVNSLEWSGIENFKKAKRKFWYVKHGATNYDLAGYFTTYDKLTVVLVRSAGHMVPADQPDWAYNLIHRFTTGGFY